MGVLVTKDEDPALYANVREEACRLFRIGVDAKPVVEPVVAAGAKPPPLPGRGCCIRCKAAVTLNPEHPYCGDCFKSWKRYENPAYQEKHCHMCGADNASTFAKPICYDCYSRHKAKPTSKR
jgi:hypothetical protein